VAEGSGPDFGPTPQRRGCGDGERSGGAMIEVEQSAQSLGFANRPGLATCTRVGEGDDIGEPLMIDQERNHRGLDNKIIRPEFNPLPSTGTIRCRKRLGGMLNYYYREAA
jgi:hypothetical protein